MKRCYGDIIDELEENGYIDDEDYITRTINEYEALNNLSIKEIKYKLYSKGIANDLIDSYIINHMEELLDYEMDSAKKIVCKKENIMEKDDIAQYLLKKGYQKESVKYAIKEDED